MPQILFVLFFKESINDQRLGEQLLVSSTINLTIILTPPLYRQNYQRPTFKSYHDYLKDTVSVTFRLHPDCGMCGGLDEALQ